MQSNASAAGDDDDVMWRRDEAIGKDVIVRSIGRDSLDMMNDWDGNEW